MTTTHNTRTGGEAETAIGGEVIEAARHFADQISYSMPDLDRDRALFIEAIIEERQSGHAERDALKQEKERVERNRDMWKGQVERQAAELTRLRAGFKPSDELIEQICQSQTSCTWPDDFGATAQAARRRFARETFEIVAAAIRNGDHHE